MHYEELIKTLHTYGQGPSRLIVEDEVSGLSNRRFLLHSLDYKVAWEALADCPVCLLRMGLDRFKRREDAQTVLAVGCGSLRGQRRSCLASVAKPAGPRKNLTT